MNERNLRVLEFEKIRERLAGFTLSAPGKALALALVPSGDPGTVALLQAQTEEAGAIQAYIGGSPMGHFSDVSGSLTVAKAGGTLSTRALLDVAELYKTSRLARGALVTEREDTPHLTQMGSGLVTNRNLEEEIYNAILSEDEIADRASPELYDIRRHIRLLNDRMRDKLNQFARNPSMSKYLQDTIITMRNGRYVVPVRAECRQNVPGLVHDQSASGQTLYIEPMAVVEAGNDLKQWTAKEQQEIERILGELSGRIGPDAGDLKNNIILLAELDMIFARLHLGREMQGVTPKLNSEGRINLIAARHPMIDPAQVVPIDLWMGGPIRQLIVTGPNTGGKTVTLKTCGLLTLMAQAGMQIPADPGSEVAVFDEVFADIGDEQSIEQSLSTFSSHMTNIVAILKGVTENSLALFDELGAGTDPTEGAALAVSILTELMGRGATVMATTHYAELKAYALSTPGVENASVEFDVQTLRPTYRLSIGVPGKSNAFEISRRLGLPERLIRDAGERLTRDQVRFEDVIANAEYHRQIAEKERALAEQAHRETQQIRDEADRLRREMEEQRKTLMKKTKEDARRVLTRAQQESEALIAELKRARRGDRQVKDHELGRMRRQIQQALDDTKEKLGGKAAPEGEVPTELKVGDNVLLTHLNTRAVVLTEPDGKGDAMVQAGAVKIKANMKQMLLVKPEKKKKESASHAQLSIRQVSWECDLRGMSLEEALTAADLFLDGAMLAALKNVTIIHGKGTGVLRRGIHEHLKKQPHVKEFRLGRYGEGEDGVTVVTLK
ncbi:MAG: endonuclease MutS2 [Clostridiales bacterium]|nr:endonuclease MutS2 [Bacillota bacterium]NLL53618.1 endonuclease MutS2 [Clostridiales bacterium]